MIWQQLIRPGGNSDHDANTGIFKANSHHCMVGQISVLFSDNVGWVTGRASGL